MLTSAADARCNVCLLEALSAAVGHEPPMSPTSQTTRDRSFAANIIPGVASTRRLSRRLHRQQRDAFDAEFLAGAARVVRDELVRRIVLDFDHVHACGCDLGAIVVLLGGSANACGP